MGGSGPPHGDRTNAATIVIREASSNLGKLSPTLVTMPIALPAETSYSGPDRVHPGLVVEEESKSTNGKRTRWLWPLVATGLAGAAVVLRGCWHSKMSWPVRSQGCAYQVCTGCGIKRLFDEDVFRGYGPYSYDLQRLLALDQAKRLKHKPVEAPTEHRSAS